MINLKGETVDAGSAEPAMARVGGLVVAPQPEPPATVVPMTLVQRAFEAGNLELVERAMALQERWEKEQARKAFEAALAMARGKLPVIIKNRSVGFDSQRTGGRTSYKHEDLAAISAAIDQVLGECGLNYRFRPVVGDKMLTVFCIISHRDGHTEESSLSAPHDNSGNKNSIQAVGSTQTYLQRYCLKAALGLAAGEDDDGRSHGNGAAPAQQQPEQPTAITPEQVEMLRQAMTMREMPEERLIKWASKAWRGGAQIADITDIPSSAFQVCLDKIRSSGEPK